MHEQALGGLLRKTACQWQFLPDSDDSRNTRLAPRNRYAIERLQHDNAGVVELVDTPDLGSGAFRFGGSSPSARTIETEVLTSTH